MMADRRSILGTIGAMGLAGLLGGCAHHGAASAGRPFFQRIGKPIGIQLYALGDDVGADLPGTLRMVKAMGYGEVELPNLYGRSAAELKAMADEAEVSIASLHMQAQAFMAGGGLSFESDPDDIAEAAHTLDLVDLVVPFPILPPGFAPGEGEAIAAALARAFAAAGADHWHAMAERFNQIGAAMAERGLNFVYHNHNMEFAPVGGTRPWDILVAECDPALVQWQLDLGWIVTAGDDPLHWLEALSGRVRSLHVKDVGDARPPNFYLDMASAEVGSGIIDWTRLLPAAHAAGVQHYFVEQEAPFAIPRAEAMRKSASFLGQIVA